MKITCVIPAYNEAANIASVIEKVRPFVQEIIVVDDGSKDNLTELIRQTGALALRHPINRGQGAALQTGNEYALLRGADIIVHFDADNQFLAEDIKDVIAPILAGEADVVFGSRFMGKESNMPTFKKKIIMPIAKGINKLFFNINLSDPQSGFRAMTSAAAQTIKIENDRMAHCNEILIKTFKNKLRVKEVPITVVYHEFGQRASGGFRIIKDLILRHIIN